MSSYDIGSASSMMHNLNSQTMGASQATVPEAQAFAEMLSGLEMGGSSQSCDAVESTGIELQSPLSGMSGQELEELLLSALETDTDIPQDVIPSDPEPVNTLSPSNTEVQPIDSASNPFNNAAIEALRSQPELLDSGPERGAKEFSNLNLQTGTDGYLTADSRQKVDQLLQDLTDGLGGREVHASVYDTNGELNIRLTAGSTNAVTHRVMPDTLYNAHTHPGGTMNPSAIDLYSANRYAQDAVVVDGQSYIYA